MPRPGKASAPVVPTPDPESINLGPIASQILSILEAVDYHSRMTRRLQNQLANITSELVKLQEKTDPGKSSSADTTAANVLRRTISVLSINSSNSEQISSTGHKNQEPANDEQSVSKSTSQRSKHKKGNKSLTTNVQSQSRHYIQRIKPSKTLIIGDSVRIRIRIRIVTGETPKRQSLTRTCD